MLVSHFPSPLEGGGKCLRLVGYHPSPLEGEGAVVLEPSGESYECGCGVKTIIHEYPPTVSDHFPLKGGRCLRLQSTSFVFPCPLGESGFSVGRCRACGSGSTVRKDVNSFPQASKPVRWREAGNFPTPRIIQGGKCIEWLVVSPRPLGERVEFQVERERNLEIRVWG